jgi:PAS domain S-box-containing protein
MRPRASLRRPVILSRRLFSLIIRSLVITTMSFGVAFGFLSGTTGSHYDPYSFAIGVAALFGASCGAMGIFISRIRQMKQELRQIEAALDKAADRNWEIREAQERDKNFFEAQGDVIVRRDGNGAITYANDAFCVLAGRTRDDLLGTGFLLPVEDQGNVALLADGTRVHDQSILTSEGPRWIAWREVVVRSETGSEMQSVGRDVTDRVEAERALGEARGRGGE